MRRRRRGGDDVPAGLLGMFRLASVLAILACAVPLAGGARPPEVVLDPSASATGATLRASFTEGDAPLRLTSDALLAGVEGGAPLTRALVKIANPTDAPVEHLGIDDDYAGWYERHGAPFADAVRDVARETSGPGVDLAVVAAAAADPASWTGRVTVTIRPDVGELDISAPLARGEELLDAIAAPTTHAIREALRHVTYRHGGKRPDTATRGISFAVTDAHGAVSAPAAFLVDVVSVNDPPELDLNGLHRPGVGYASSMGEHERVLGVAMADADLHVGDPDGSLIVRGRVAYDPTGSATGLSEFDFPDGDAESVELDLRGTSVTGAWDARTRAFELTGPDTVDAYRRILASARYVNRGELRVIATQAPPTSELGFTAGVRKFTFEVEDVDGSVTRAVAEVFVSEVVRVGDPTRDELQRTPEECSGAGYRDAEDELGTGDPEACVCDPGFEGDKCEIHPCGYRGTLVFLDPETGEKTCECVDKFSGDVCDVECSGNGKYDEDSGECKCGKGWTGILCDAACDGCDGEFGNCSLTAFSASTWQPDTQEYLLVDTVCSCVDDYMGANCTIPCPCAKGGFGKGTCAVDLVKLESGEYPDDELGVCICQDGYVGADCTIPCPACVSGQGTCRPPIGYEAGVGATLLDLAATYVGSTLAAKVAEATVDGACACDASVENVFGGFGYAGDDCSVPCRPCDMGECQADGTCRCFPGYSGWRCQDQCNGNGIILFPEFNETHTRADFDNLPLVPGNANYNSSGLFDVHELYGVSQTPTNDTAAYCACGYRRNADTDAVEPIPLAELPFNTENGQGYTGPFCDVPCDPCLSTNGKCEYDGTRGVCDCFKDAPNAKGSESKLLPAGTKGFGFVGPSCFYPCEPCFNGTCSSEPGSYGKCVCAPGYSDPACLIECGDPGTAYAYRESEEATFGMTVGQISAGEVYIGSRGVVNLTGAEPGAGLRGTTVTCECDYMWTGPTCSHPCPYPYDEAHGICVVKDPGDSDYGQPWTAEVVCEDGWTGLPEESLRLVSSAPSRGRNCSMPCFDCVHGTCQDDGSCLCDYGYIWQGPLAATSDIGEREPISPFPELLYGPFYQERYHTCAAKHPCNMNGELFNATCGPNGNGFVDNLTAWTVLDGDGRNGGYGCTGVIVNGTQCVDENTGAPAPNLFSMAYAVWDTFVSNFVRTDQSKRLFDQWGQVQGGYCDVDDVDLVEGQPFHGGYCVCDSIRNGRFEHPSAKGFESKGYDYYFQGWAGDRCEIPCAPCSENGLCNAQTGECDCFEGWAGFRCLTPCEPCDHGTCQYDGTCLCDGTRRLQEGTYALRLTRDPFYIERGEHVYEVQGEKRSRYVHPVYMHTYDLEDYIWELEYECPNRAECRDRTPDTHLPTRPNETYFRYTTPNIIEVLKVNDELKELQAYRDSLVTDVEGVPGSMEDDEVCEYTDVTNVVEKGKCLEKMRSKLFGRTTRGCGTEWDSIRPWDCDDVVKSHFVRERNLELGKVEVMSMKSVQSTEAENVWFANNVNERQRLINTMTRGRFNASTGAFETIRDPDYHMIWIVHQLIHGVTSGDGYTGWQCSVKCEECNPDHGTCQYDGTCECAEGWYGPSCNRRCDCYRHVAVKNALELRDQTEDVMLEAVESHSGFPIQPHGTCQRDGSCRCYADPDGTQWTGRDCFTRCKPCSHGHCRSDGECECELGWTGESCDTPRFVLCFPCDFEHGMCLSDGTCKCLRGYTGYDCSLKCSPCVHGDCQMDGQCYCRPGWTLPDCSKKIWDGGIIRSDFSLSSEGWRVHNNSCPGKFEYVEGAEMDHGASRAATIRGRCLGDGDGDGDSGLEWDGASGFLYLTDRLPRDGPGEIAYFRAPAKFLGDRLDDAYNATLAYELYLAGGGDPFRNAAATPTTPHEPGSDAEQSPDVILVGGKPRHKVELPPWDIWDKHSVYEWSRENFPELPLNVRWSKDRLVRTVEAYLDTPQVVLGIRALRVPHYPPETCVAEHCSVNFNFDLIETAGWFNMHTIPQGFGWSDVDPGDRDERGDREARDFVYQTEGTEYVGKKAGAPYDPFAGVARERFRTDGSAGVPSPDPRATVGTRGDGGEPEFIWERGDGASVPNRGNPDLATVLESVADAGGDPTSTRAVLAAIADPFKPGYDWQKPGAQGAYPPGRYPGGGGFAGTWSNSENHPGSNDGGWRSARRGDERRRWDVLPEVYEAVHRNRASRVGQPASFSDMAWCLSSLTEVLIRADYYGDDLYRGHAERFAATNAMGPGETVRLDHVMIAKKDPHVDPEHWLALEFAAFMRWVDRYSRDYSVKYLSDYFADYNETLRLSICSGNGQYKNGDPALGCVCYENWLGEACELACPACVNGVCAPGPVDADGNATAVCECDEGWAGTLCDVECPPCDYTRSKCSTDEAGQPSCACDPGYGGAYCQLDCPPCDYEVSSCGSATYIGEFPGTAATCACDDPTQRTGILCELVCPQPSCGNGACAHALEGRSYADTTVQQRAGDNAFCRCESGWVGPFCDDPCPGGLNHTTLPGPEPCLGRGECALGSSGTAVCNCVTGYIGQSCDQAIGVCGDGLLNPGEECDDGNADNLDGCDNGCRIEANFRCEGVPRSDVKQVDGVAPSLISQCTCPGILSPVLGCLVA